MVVGITSAQVLAAKQQGLIYFWRIELRDGKVGCQFTESGLEVPIGTIVNPSIKPATDPYKGSFSFAGVSRAWLLPVYDKLQALRVDLDTHEELVLYRKTHQWSNQYRYIVYCIGKRWMAPDPVEEVYYVCPPTILPSSNGGSGKQFPGGIGVSTLPDYQDPFDAFCKK